MFDKNAKQVVSYIYDTWGRLISIKNESGIDITNDKSHVGYKNSYRYRGYRYDSETQLYYLNSRYYNPEWCRYLNADALVGVTGLLLSHNVFAYSMNNPVNMVDPNGYLPRLLENAIQGARDFAKEVYDYATNVVAEVKAYAGKVVAEAKVVGKKIISDISNKLSSSPAHKNTASGAIDKSAEYGANRLVKKSISGWKSYGTMGLSSSIRKPTTLGGSIISHSAQYTGTAIFAGTDIIGDMYRKEYFSLGVDAGGVFLGLRLGSAVGTAIEGGLIAMGMSASATVIPVFIGSVVVGVAIDKFGSIIKDHHYGGK
ncbi:RHS repeat-associated core domain-containing protein [Clostridium sp. CX1]|uniref:RHS repeat-associated core domain-containing protein n=1 Tax=Clostridium tanneri TaxID=3037988 RepID=A0ABU4JYP4_9CLOT|nr:MULTISPECIES: RHS repeat-associated core domain-containing protein [unclassified Clostridium]MCT8976977.1 RHS repeat-associated core domain-containing protein [Clostridium sp. CX1]MDW8803048.1 RHS repeat-associated core domain-containing protein [Clostridium sp. A1-XYC3]